MAEAASVQTLSPKAAVDEAHRLYTDAVDALRSALVAFAETGTAPSETAYASGMFAYPVVCVDYAPVGAEPQISSALGTFTRPGRYELSVTQPALFRTYLEDQLGSLVARYGQAVTLSVRPGRDQIPYPYVLTKADQDALSQADPRELAHVFPTPDLSAVTDDVADAEVDNPHGPWPLGLFDAQRTDFSLARIAHYTGTPAAAVQSYVLFTNYTHYVEEFAHWAVEAVRGGGPYTRLTLPGGYEVTAATPDPEAVLEASPGRKFQMPAYHLETQDGTGISLVNIGVGPSNAKTMTDHLAVLRPQCWLMIGHCGGLRHAQRLGDYVLAHAYLRRDRVLDPHVPLEIPIPPIAEVQVALQDAAAQVTGETGDALKGRLRTGTVVTNADRNWELRASAEARLFNKSRAIAVDMESATVATNGFRFRVPYGTLLCVSDKPLHGELKLPGPAREFYQKAVSQHFKIAIAAVELLRRDGGARLHSRKLRAFDEPPFR